MNTYNNYIKVGWRRAWILWDLDNGHAKNQKDNGEGYFWVFTSRQEALNHKKYQYKLKNHARLSQPIKIEYHDRTP